LRSFSTAWGTKEGAPDQIVALAQTKDGYLWMGTGDGLYRFDGLTFERYEPRSGGPLPTKPHSLWSNGRGDLWIGARSIANTLRDGNLRTYRTQDGIPDGVVNGFAEDREGTMWVASDGGLARLEGNRWKKVGEDWNFPGHSAQTIFLDREETLWVATENTLVFLPSGAKAF
jgi:ligand-binding sensor domain-containing protein